MKKILQKINNTASRVFIVGVIVLGASMAQGAFAIEPSTSLSQSFNSGQDFNPGSSNGALDQFQVTSFSDSVDLSPATIEAFENVANLVEFISAPDQPSQFISRIGSIALGATSIPGWISNPNVRNCISEESEVDLISENKSCLDVDGVGVFQNLVVDQAAYFFDKLVIGNNSTALSANLQNSNNERFIIQEGGLLSSALGYYSSGVFAPRDLTTKENVCLSTDGTLIRCTDGTYTGNAVTTTSDFAWRAGDWSPCATAKSGDKVASVGKQEGVSGTKAISGTRTSDTKTSDIKTSGTTGIQKRTVECEQAGKRATDQQCIDNVGKKPATEQKCALTNVKEKTGCYPIEYSEVKDKSIAEALKQCSTFTDAKNCMDRTGWWNIDESGVVSIEAAPKADYAAHSYGDYSATTVDPKIIDREGTELPVISGKFTILGPACIWGAQ